MRAPVRLVEGGWPGPVERVLARFVRPDPAGLVEPDTAPEQFRRLMSLVHVGDTIKITGSDRHPDSDALLTERVDLRGRTVVDIGASDGSTSVDLIARLDDFGAYVIADLYLEARWVRRGGHLFLYDSSGRCVLVSGRHLVAWPGESRAVRMLYGPLIRAATRGATDSGTVLLLNPAAQQLIRTDPRVSYRVHDVFTAWSGSSPPYAIKIANLLRRLYFSDDDIVRALVAVHHSLDEDGVLLVVDNPRIAGIDERGGLFRRTSHGFELIATTEHPPEIGDLVTTVSIA